MTCSFTGGGYKLKTRVPAVRRRLPGQLRSRHEQEPLMSLQVVTRSCRALARCSRARRAGRLQRRRRDPGQPAVHAAEQHGRRSTPVLRRRMPTCRPSRSTCGRTSCPRIAAAAVTTQGGQSPQFARTDDVNLAYQAAGPLVNLTQPNQSTLVLKVGGGHNCWVADPSACAATMLVWIQNWLGSGASSTSTRDPGRPAGAGGRRRQAVSRAGAGGVSEHRLSRC